MRVTTGLGAEITALPSATAVGGPTDRLAIPANPRPLPGPVRWRGTADGAGRSRSRSGFDQSRSDRQWSDRDESDQQLHALRQEADRYGSERTGTGRYRGSREWSDRDRFTSSSSRGFPPPLRLRAPRAPVTPVPEPAETSLFDPDVDPTPLFTATEYVAIGDSPLYQFVAEFIGVGDGLLVTELAEPVAPVGPRAEFEVAEEKVPADEAELDSPVEGSDLGGGKHRDGWRVAGHQPSVDGSPRSARRSPRHRAA